MGRLILIPSTHASSAIEVTSSPETQPHRVRRALTSHSVRLYFQPNNIMAKEKLNNARLEQITDLVSTDVRTLIAESEREILKDYHTVVEEAQDEGKEKMPSLKLAIAVDFDPEKNSVQTKLSWSVKKTRTEDHVLDDLTQGNLELPK